MSLDSMLPSKSKKMNDDSSGSSRLTLAQRSDEMEMYLRKFTVFFVRENSGGGFYPRPLHL